MSEWYSMRQEVGFEKIVSRVRELGFYLGWLESNLRRELRSLGGFLAHNVYGYNAYMRTYIHKNGSRLLNNSVNARMQVREKHKHTVFGVSPLTRP